MSDVFAVDEGAVSAPAPEGERPLDPSGQDAGWWVTHPNGAEVKAAVLATWKRSDSYERKRSAKDRKNELVRSGVRGVQVVEDDETDTASLRFAFSATEASRAPSKADQLLRRVVSTLTVDPPAADVTPNSDDDAEREAAQLAERVLRVEGSPAKRDDVSFLRQVLDLGATYGSMFALTTWHPQAGGLAPLAIEAHPQAATVDDALFETVETVDELTGEPVRQQVPADPSTLVTRYVRLDGSLTDRQDDAQMVWQGDYGRHMLRPAQVRILPVTAQSIEDAHGVLVGRVMTLAEFVAECYDGERPTEEVIKKLVAWRPEGWRQWIPSVLRDVVSEEVPNRPNGTTSDEAFVCVLTLYFKSCAVAPLGAKVVVTGADEPKRETQKVLVGAEDQRRPIMLPLPVSWFRWAEDTATGDPKGVAGIEQLAPHEEIRGKALAYLLDYMHRFGSPRTYLPMTSAVQPEDFRMGGDVPVRLNPGDQPFFENVPPLPATVPQLYEAQGAEMDSASGLEEAAQGVSSSSVKSGVHAQQIIEQALVALAGVQQNGNRFMCRVWRNELEYLRAFVDVPRQLAMLGESGDVQVRAFVGADLVGAGDIQVARGTGTMMPKSAKTAMAREELMMAMQTGDQMGALRYQRTVTGNTAPLLGLQDDPHRARIARQVSQWKDVATKQHPPAPEPLPQFDPMTGVETMVPAPDPVADEANKLFQPNPTDELPQVAPLRFAELADTLASRAFLQADPRYQQALYVEYERMRAASGVQTKAEVDQQQQQAAMQQQAMLQEQVESKNAEQAAKTAYAERGPSPVAQLMTRQDAAGKLQPPIV